MATDHLPGSAAGTTLEGASQGAIRVSGLTKVFDKGVRAVDRISFEVREGEVFGFLGPNGAGKTTTIHMLTTVLRPTEGHARVRGFDVVREARQVRRTIGVVPQEYTADEDLTGCENVLLCTDLYGIPRPEGRRRAEELLGLLELADAARRRVETYSGGMRRRLEIACGLVNRPRVLFLDEPTLGLDVQTRTAVWDYIRRLKDEEEMTLFLTTHYLEEADALCDRIAIIDRGRIVATGSPAELKAGLGGDVIDLTVGGADDGLADALRRIPSVREVQARDGTYRIKAANGAETAPPVIDAVRERGLRLLRIGVTKPTLDEAYLEHTGRSLRVEEGTWEDALRTQTTIRRARGRAMG